MINTPGKLTVITGPMYAGKTTELVREALLYRHQGRRVVAVKPDIDTRYTDEEIATHTGITIEATPVAETHQILPHTLGEVGLLVIDEVQFFDKGLPQLVHKLVHTGFDCIVAGLDQDYRAEPFENTARLMAMADEVKKLQAWCAVCGKPATKTYKKAGKSKKRIEVGENDTYEARCNEHWLIEGVLPCESLNE